MDDFFVRTFSPTGTAVSSSIEVSGGAHTEALGIHKEIVDLPP